MSSSRTVREHVESSNILKMFQIMFMLPDFMCDFVWVASPTSFFFVSTFNFILQLAKKAENNGKQWL
jgi:hypothetical protein